MATPKKEAAPAAEIDKDAVIEQMSKDLLERDKIIAAQANRNAYVGFVFSLCRALYKTRKIANGRAANNRRPSKPPSIKRCMNSL